MRKQKLPIPEELRQRVFKRDGYRCRYCGSKEGPFHADHVYPESKGGVTSFDNLVTACKRCNSKKRAKIGIWPKPIEYGRDLERLETNYQRELAALEGKYKELFRETETKYESALRRSGDEKEKAIQDAINTFVQNGKNRADIWGVVLAVSSILMSIGMIVYVLLSLGMLVDVQPETAKTIFNTGIGIELLAFGMGFGGKLALRRKQ